MSIQTAKMNPFYNPTTTRRPGFFRRLVLIVLFVMGITSFMALVYARQKNLSPFLMIVFAMLSVGLATGAASRIAFYHRSGFTRFFTVFIVLPLAMFELGVLTNWQLGIGPLNPWARGIIPQDELIQLGGALLVAFISLEAWWKPRSRINDVLEVPRSTGNRIPSPTPLQPFQPRRQTPPQESLTFQPKKGSYLKFMKASKTRGRSASATDTLSIRHTSPTTRLRRKGSARRKLNLQLSLYEEHRCPFCLEEVKRNDPRGVKKCEVCNALHHADCWAVTGMCQVPHLNT
jgi:ribosomal protein L37AE/L43A